MMRYVIILINLLCMYLCMYLERFTFIRYLPAVAAYIKQRLKCTYFAATVNTMPRGRNRWRNDRSDSCGDDRPVCTQHEH